MTGIGVKYSCAGCGIVRQAVIVQAREEGQDVVDWMERTVWRVHQDHRSRSPQCREAAMSELLIPAADRRIIGGELVQ